MADIKEKVLSSQKAIPDIPLEWRGKAFIHIIFDILRAELKQKGSRDWLIDATTSLERPLSLQEVELRSLEAAHALSALGLKKGQVVHIILPNCIQFHVTVFGVWLLGAVASLGDPGLSENVLAQQIKETDSTIVVCSQSNRNKAVKAAAEGKKEAQVVIVDDWFRRSSSQSEQEKDGKEKSLPMLTYDENETMVIFWSSGTTGRPKGIAHGIRFFLRSLVKSPFPPTTILQTTCFFHTGGFFTPIVGATYNGHRVIFRDANIAITPESILLNVHRHHPVVIVCGSHHAIQLAALGKQRDFDDKELDLASVKILAPMGAAVPTEIVADLQKVFPTMMPAVMGYYGMSEVGTISNARSPNNLGALAPGCQVKILGENGKLQGANEVGEILAKTPTIMNGYINHPEENAKFFDDPDGFIHTGDLGFYDEKGVLYYHGRSKELIKYQNCHVYPVEIEDIALRHPNIKDIGVFGKPDPSVQELVSAVVVVKEGQLTEKDVVDFVNERIESSKHIRGGVKFVSEIPRNPQGKIQRSKLALL